MNEHVEAIREVLNRFVDEHRGGAPEALPPIVRPSGLGQNIHASVHVPRFDQMSLFERQRMIWDYVNRELAPEHRVHLIRMDALTSDEWDAFTNLPHDPLRQEAEIFA